MRSKIYAELTITCRSKNIDELSSLTGLPATDGHQIGDTAVTGITLDYSEWSYSTAIVQSYDTNEAAAFLMREIGNEISDLAEFVHINNCDSTVCLIIHERGEPAPAFGLSKDFVSFAASLNASINFDGVY